MITFKENETIRDMATLKLHCLLADIKNELNRREVSACSEAQTALYKAVEAFQATGFDSVFVTTDGQTIDVRDISEIYNDKLDCGFCFGIARETVDTTRDYEKFFLDN